MGNPYSLDLRERNRDDIDDRDFAADGLLRIRLLTTKTTGPENARACR